MKQNEIKQKTKSKNVIIVLLINDTIMSLQGPLVRKITVEILHCVKNLCIIYMGNLLVTIFMASLKAFKDSFSFISSGISSHILGKQDFQFHYIQS